MVAQQRLVQATTALTLDHEHVPALAAHLVERVFLGVIHGGRVGERRRVEVLHLIQLEAVGLDPERHVHHVFIRGARVGRDEVGDQVLLLARLFGILVEQLLEAVVAAHARLHHLGERALLGVLGRDLEVAADVVLGQLLDVARIFHRYVVAHAGGDQYLLDALHIPRLAIEIDSGGMVGIHVRAYGRPDAGGAATGLLGLGALATQLVHVGGGAAEIRDDAGKARHLVADLFDLFDDRLFRAALDDAPLVLCDGAEGATAEAAAHDVDRGLDHLVGRDLLLAIGRVRHPLIRQAEHAVHLVGFQREGRRVDPDDAIAVGLGERAGAAGVGLVVQDARRMGVEHLVFLHPLERRQLDVGLLPGLLLGRLHQHRLGLLLHRRRAFVIRAGRPFHIGVHDGIDAANLIQLARIHPAPARQRLLADHGGAANVLHGVDGLTVGDAVRHLDQRPLGVAIDEDVGLGVQQYGATYGLGPVVVVGDTAKGSLNAADDHGDLLEGLLAALGVDQGGAVRPLAAHIPGGVGVVVAQLLVGGVAVDHGVHVARGHPVEEVRLAQAHEVILG
ncbi:hypothetical protein D3C80_678240 [compost metagenome]